MLKNYEYIKQVKPKQHTMYLLNKIVEKYDGIDLCSYLKSVVSTLIDIKLYSKMRIFIINHLIGRDSKHKSIEKFIGTELVVRQESFVSIK